MTNAKRFGNRWTINECLTLEREFELLQLSIDEIARRHQRTPNAIMFKLSQEKFADYTTLYNAYYLSQCSIGKHSVEKQEEQEQEEDDDDDSSDYQDADNQEEDVDDDDSSDYQDTDNKDTDDYDIDDLKHHVFRLEKKVNELTQLLLSQPKDKKGVFSIFS